MKTQNTHSTFQVGQYVENFNSTVQIVQIRRAPYNDMIVRDPHDKTKWAANPEFCKLVKKPYCVVWLSSSGWTRSQPLSSKAKALEVIKDLMKRHGIKKAMAVDYQQSINIGLPDSDGPEFEWD